MGLDWFDLLPGQQSPEDSLAKIAADLEFKQRFVAKLREKFQGEADPLLILSAKSMAMEKTLKFRLTILRPERPGAWFRAPLAANVGPFSSAIISEPIFCRYGTAKLSLLKSAIRSAWAKGDSKDIPFEEDTRCLWKTLIESKKHWNEIDQLGHYQLTELNDDLPPQLESANLRAFLLQTQVRLLDLRVRLDNCFSELWRASEKFWAYQEKTGGLGQDRYREANDKSHQQRAEEVRQSFRDRRAKAASSFQKAERDALSFMGFHAMPDTCGLKRRYIELAKKLHPDCNGGEDSGFKKLNAVYRQLSNRQTP
jgi:hypothetical protein